MITVLLTSRPDMPIRSARCSSAASRIADDRLLDAEVDDGVAVVGQDDVDEVLADVVHVALDGGEHDRALALLVGLLHVRLEPGDRGLHHLGRLQHEGQLHLALAEQLADDLHATEEVVVDDVERGAARVERLLEVGLEAVALAVDDPAGQPLPEGQRGELLRRGSVARPQVDALEQVEEARQRVVGRFRVGGRPPTVIDHVESDLALLLLDLGHRQDLGRVHDGRVEPGLGALVQEHAVEHDTGGGVEAERDVGQAQRRLHRGVEPLDLGGSPRWSRGRRGASPPARWRSGRSVRRR